MLIHYDPDDHETVSEHRTCEFHKMHPGEAWAGCTCSFSVGSRRCSPDEIVKIKADSLRKEEDRILAQAEIIKARRSLSAQHGEDG